MLSVKNLLHKLGIIMLSVVMLSAVILSVMAPAFQLIVLSGYRVALIQSWKSPKIPYPRSGANVIKLFCP